MILVKHCGAGVVKGLCMALVWGKRKARSRDSGRMEVPEAVCFGWNELLEGFVATDRFRDTVFLALTLRVNRESLR